MTVNPSGWRPSTPANADGEAQTFTGNRALMLEEPLLFEIGTTDQTGVDFDPAPSHGQKVAGLERSAPIGLPGLSEPEAVRHYTRLSRQNYAIDLGCSRLAAAR
jgi:glycine dehydrogenase subunit 2